MPENLPQHELEQPKSSTPPVELPHADPAPEASTTEPTPQLPGWKEYSEDQAQGGKNNVPYPHHLT